MFMTGVLCTVYGAQVYFTYSIQNFSFKTSFNAQYVCM